jgi:hypothetical protein
MRVTHIATGVTDLLHKVEAAKFTRRQMAAQRLSPDAAARSTSIRQARSHVHPDRIPPY